MNRVVTVAIVLSLSLASVYGQTVETCIVSSDRTQHIRTPEPTVVTVAAIDSCAESVGETNAGALNTCFSMRALSNLCDFITSFGLLILVK